MPQVGVNNEPLLERAVFGFDGSDYRVVKLDTDGNIVVALKAEEDVQANGYGWISSAWQKNPIAFGYSADQTENVGSTSHAGGTQVLNGSQVPSGEIWVIQVASIRDNTNAPSAVQVQANVNGTGVVIKHELTVVAGQWIVWEGQIVLSEGDKMVGVLFGTTSNDDIDFSYHGVVVDIDQ